MADTFQLEIVTPERLLVSTAATEITVPGRGGYLGILPGHAPLISELQVGEISYQTGSGETRYLACAWGFIEVLPEKVTILAEVAERAEDIDVTRAKRAQQEADAVLKSPDLEQHSRALDDLARANARISVAAKIDPALANILP